MQEMIQGDCLPMSQHTVKCTHLDPKSFCVPVTSKLNLCNRNYSLNTILNMFPFKDECKSHYNYYALKV